MSSDRRCHDQKQGTDFKQERKRKRAFVVLLVFTADPCFYLQYNIYRDHVTFSHFSGFLSLYYSIFSNFLLFSVRWASHFLHAKVNSSNLPDIPNDTHLFTLSERSHMYTLMDMHLCTWLNTYIHPHTHQPPFSSCVFLSVDAGGVAVCVSHCITCSLWWSYLLRWIFLSISFHPSPIVLM